MKILVLLSLLLPVILHAQLEVQVSTVDSSDRRAILELKAKNSSDKDVRNARVMVLLMDDEGKVVGTKSQWLVNPNDPNLRSAETTAIEAGEERDFNVVIETKSKATSSKVICSRMVYADGSLGNLSKDFKVKKAE